MPRNLANIIVVIMGDFLADDIWCRNGATEEHAIFDHFFKFSLFNCMVELPDVLSVVQEDAKNLLAFLEGYFVLFALFDEFRFIHHDPAIY